MSYALPRSLNGEQLKYMLVVILAITLVVILKARFFGQKSVTRPAPTPASKETVVRTESRPAPQPRLPGAQSLVSSPEPKADVRHPETPSSLKRDIFVPLNPAYDPFRLSQSDGEPTGTKALKLEATITDTESSMAIIDDHVLQVGDSIQGARLISIGKNQVVLSTREGELTLRIQREAIQ